MSKACLKRERTGSTTALKANDTSGRDARKTEKVSTLRDLLGKAAATKWGNCLLGVRANKKKEHELRVGKVMVRGKPGV